MIKSRVYQMLPSLHALTINAPQYFGLDEDSSAALEDWLSDRDRRSFQSINRASRSGTAVLRLADWRRDEDGAPRGPGEWDDYTWEASLTRGRDPTGTRVQYVATLNDHQAIRGHQNGVALNIPFEEAEIGDQVYMERYEDDQFPFASSDATINIPEWGLGGRYEFEYGEQDIRSVSELEAGSNGTRVFHIRIRQAIRNTMPKVYVSFGFLCEMQQDNTALWVLRAVTVYRE